MGDDRPNTYVEGDTIIYRASSVGNCIRGLAASRIGYDPADHPDWLLAKFAEGNTNEPVILAMLEAQRKYRVLEAIEHDYPVDDHGQIEVEVGIGSTVKVRGHLDGLAVEIATGEKYMVEAKALGKSFRAKYEKDGIKAFPYYATQLSLYMEATRCPALFVLGWKDKDGKVTDIHVEVFDKPPIPLIQMKARIAKIERAKAENRLPACDQEQYPCQFYYLHEDKEEEVKAEDCIEDEEADRWAHQLQRARVMEREAKALKKEASDALDEKLKTHLGGEFVTRLFEVRYRSRSTTTYDMDGIQKKLGDQMMDYTTHGIVRWADVKAR